MTVQNSSDQIFDNNSDGFDVAGGTTSRQLKVSGGNVAIVGGGSATTTFPASTGTLALTSQIPNLEPFFVFSTDYPVTGKFVNTSVSTGTATYTAAGLTLSTGATASSSQRNLYTFLNDGNTWPIFANNPKIGLALYLSSAATLTGQWYGGLGNITVNGAGHTFTGAHIGFKITTSGGVTSLYGTVADGTTESATAALTTLVAGDQIILRAIVTASSNVAFYFNKNFTGWSAATNLTSNIPTTNTSPYIQQSVSNTATANSFVIISTGASVTY
jgi:hypothetical protein